MKNKSVLKKIFKNQVYRGYFIGIVSFLATVAFLCYNLVLGIFYKLVWNFSVSFYYLFLMLIKGIMLATEKRIKDKEKEEKSYERIKLFKLQNIFMIIIDLLLIAPVVLMLLQKKSVNIGMIPAIAAAAYTTYKIVMACINYKNSKNSGNLTLHGLKIISLKEAVVSVITLQNTLISVFGNAEDMLTLTTYTSAGLLAVMLGVSLLQIKKYRRLR